jgi:hypothetical protein
VRASQAQCSVSENRNGYWVRFIGAFCEKFGLFWCELRFGADDYRLQGLIFRALLLFYVNGIYFAPFLAP